MAVKKIENLYLKFFNKRNIMEKMKGAILQNEEKQAKQQLLLHNIFGQESEESCLKYVRRRQWKNLM